MSIKLKALGLGLVAAMAMGALAVVNASATVGGHFESEVEHTIIKGVENGFPHDLEFQGPSGEPLTCTIAEYNGTIVPKTVQTVQVSAFYDECSTGGEPPHEAVVHMNECTYTISSYNAATTKHGTVAIDCPTGKNIVITHQGCEITVPAQKPGEGTITGGVTFATEGSGKTHSLTMNVTLHEITAFYHNGLCLFLGTNKKFSMNGAVTVKGFNTANEQVGITHT